jgi:hypothetical protein
VSLSHIVERSDSLWILLRLLEKHNVFTAFYHLSELRSREDLIKGIIDNLDYTKYYQIQIQHIGINELILLQ